MQADASTTPNIEDPASDNGNCASEDKESQASENWTEINGVVDVQGTDSFMSVAEGCIKVVYGATTEDRLGELNTQALQKDAQEVCFTGFGSSTAQGVVKAHVHLQRDDSTDALLPRLTEGTFVKMHLRIQGQDKEEVVLGFSINPAFGPAHGTLLFVVVGTPIKFFEESKILGSDSPRVLTWMPLRFEVI